MSFLLSFTNVNCQDTATDKVFYIELRNGLQLNDNFKYDEHLVGGYDSFYYNNKKHYAASHNDTKPIELVLGFEYKKKFRSQIHLNYYTQEMTLDPLYNASIVQPYPLTVLNMLNIKASSLFDLLHGQYQNPRIHAWAGLTTGIIIPLTYPLNPATADHFGISKFKQNSQWLLGCDLLLTIRITKSGLYLAPAMSMLFPLYGDIGKLEMQANSEYKSTNPVKVFTANWLIGIGYRFCALASK